MGLIPASIQEKISKINGSTPASSPSKHHQFVAQRRQKHNKEFVDFLANGWPGSTLNWTKEDLGDFSACFRPIHVKCGEEIPASNDRLFFLVAEGSVEIHALVPTKSKKTDNVREFLAKKQQGDMVFWPSVRKLIGESNARETLERENRENRSPHSHKNVLDLIDTVGIKSLENSTLLQLDWPLFEAKFGPLAERPAGSKLNISMLRSIMQANLTDYLSTVPILEEISFGKLEMLSRLCRYCVKKEGDVIFEEGDKGDEAYIVLSGEVRVEALASKGVADIIRTEEEIARAEEGLEGLSGREMIIDESSKVGGISDNDDISSKSARKGSVITACDYVKGMRSRGQEKLQMRRRTLVAAGDKLRSEAKHDGHGSDDVNQQTDTVELGKLGAGDAFGEMAVFCDLPRSGTVTAESNLLLATLSNASFRTLCKKMSPGLEATLEDKIKHYMLSNLFELKSPFQETIDADHMHQMAENSSIVRYESGAIVFREGWAAEKFYFVYSGTLVVEKNACDGKHDTVGSLFSGDYFGELALITGSARLATVRATSDAVLLEISADRFASCFSSCPDLLAEFIFRINGASADLKSVLDCKMAREVFSNADGFNTSELALYDAIANYEKGCPGEGGISLQVWKKAKDIVDRYLTVENEEYYVDLPDDATKEARERVAFDVDGEVDRSTFLVAKQLVHERLTSKLDEFKMSAEFAALLKRMRCYDDVGNT